MKLSSVNPTNGETGLEFDCWSKIKLQQVVNSVTSANQQWTNINLNERAQIIRQCGQLLIKRKNKLSELITSEMGKITNEADAEIDKCIFTCQYYADNAAAFLADELVNSDATHSFIRFQPLGIMPWNFPFWQVFRFAIPALISGNTVLLKHASNVPQCALAAEQLLHDSGIPNNVFRSLMINSRQLDPLYADTRIRGIALTGSEQTGRHVAQQAGAHLKKVVLELGGSDAFLVLEDANIEDAVKTAVASRFFTSGQSCINAKRIILVNAIAENFTELFFRAVSDIKVGNPRDPSAQVGPMVREDLRHILHIQVMNSINMGAVAKLGCQMIDGPGFFYQPSILDNVTKGRAIAYKSACNS